MLHLASDTLADRYRLGARLGAGGFGAVYEADDLETGERVAAKLLDPGQAHVSAEQAERLRERFIREATAMAAIHHPNVVSVFDVGRDGDRVFIIMELLAGRSLARELDFWPTGIEAPRLLPLFVDALRGLGEGHAAGIVHKDLKPENLFVCDPQTPSELLRIIDFGVARVLHEQKLTATGKLVGTPRYLAPEYILKLQVSPALDVYQMGLILVEALCSKPCIPRRLDLVTCCQRHVDGNLVIPTGLREGLIGEVIARATAVKAADRFVDANEFADALAAVDPEEVFPEGGGEKRATRRLGIVPLNQATERMAAIEAATVDTQSPSRIEWTDEVEEERPPVSGPTRRIGPASDVQAEIARMEREAEAERRTTEAHVPVGLPTVIVSPEARQPEPTDIVDAPTVAPAPSGRRWGRVIALLIAILLVGSVAAVAMYFV